MIKERPILFSGPMVRAILDGQKTMTRRVVKWRDLTPGLNLNFTGLHAYSYTPSTHTLEARVRNGWERRSSPTPCPFGKPGDQLWVRETWAEVPRHEPQTDEDLPWRKDGRILVHAADPQWDGARPFLCADGCLRWAKPQKWRPSIFMPRWASRILLDITDVRVERLKSISEADAQAEGAEPTPFDHGSAADRGLDYMPCMEINHPHRNGFALLWEQINGKGSWTANPWVWAITFKRAEVPA